MSPRLANLASGLASLAFLIGCTKQAPSEGAAKGQGRGGGAVPVVAGTVLQKEMPVILQAVGNVRASASVSIKPRVGGQIASVEFQEGEDVKKGDVLFRLDPQPFQVALAQAKANLAQVRASAENAEKQAQRYSSLGKTGVVAKEQIDQLQTTARASGSGTDAAEAAVEEAEMQLGYATVKSPISGRAGRRMVDAGNVVTANTTDLVLINQVRPVEVLFTLPEQAFGDLMHYMQEGEISVTATPPGQDNRLVKGKLTFVDNTVKAASGTIDVKATFPNEDLALWPGQFANVAVTLTTEQNASVVPAPAVQTGQNGSYVFVIKEDQSVEYRPVELARTVGAEAVIRSGVAGGERVVTEGHLRLVPGTKVQIRSAAGTAVAATAVGSEAKPARNPSL